MLRILLWLVLFAKAADSEFSYGYETEEFTLAVINISYYSSQSRTTIYSEKGEVGKFGGGKIGTVSGLVVHVTNKINKRRDACEPIDPEIIPPEPWIALAQFGSCKDAVKLRHIINTTASAAVIYNNKPGSRLIKMYAKVYNLISVFVTKEKGEHIAYLVDNGTKVMMHISPGSHSSFRYANINRTSVLFVSVSFIILMIISLTWLVFYYVQRFRYIHAKDIISRRLCNAAKKALDKIPTKTIRANDFESSAAQNPNEFTECCAVCIEQFKAGDVVRLLPCKHVFHKVCVDPWLLDQRSCPMCKMDILKHYGLSYPATSQDSVFNVDDYEVNQHTYWYRSQRRGSGDIQVIHIPISYSTPVRSISSERRSQSNTVVQSSSHVPTAATDVVDQSSEANKTQTMGQHVNSSETKTINSGKQ